MQPYAGGVGATKNAGVTNMATVLLFHHALGLTSGVQAFAEAVRTAGHTVHCPDLYDGNVFDSIDDGVAHAESLGFEAVMAAGVGYAERLPQGLVYAGFSLGVLPAQKLAQTRPGARGALLYHEAIPMEVTGAPWPTVLPVQVHVTDGDPWADHEAIRDLMAQAEDGELFTYPGNAHLFADSSFTEFQPESAELLMTRTLTLLDRVS